MPPSQHQAYILMACKQADERISLMSMKEQLKPSVYTAEMEGILQRQEREFQRLQNRTYQILRKKLDSVQLQIDIRNLEVVFSVFVNWMVLFKGENMQENY